MGGEQGTQGRSLDRNSLVVGQGDKQVKLVAGEIGRFAAHEYSARIAVDFQAAKAQHLGGLGSSGARPMSAGWLAVWAR